MTTLRDLELYLVRHAVAAERGSEWPDDTVRPLTPDGASKFRKCVAGMAAFGVEIDIIFTSPLVRCRQTADLLADGLPGKPRVQAIDALAPGGGHAAVVAEIARLAKRPRIALVGHEPDLGHLAAKLIVALLIEEFVYRAESISPWGYPLRVRSAVATDATSP